MAVYSMTGFASAAAGTANVSEDTAGSGGAQVLVEMRSVNGRFLDLSLRLPDDLRGLEPALRELVGGAVRRGKVELRVATQREADDAWPRPTPEQMHRLSSLESTVLGWMPKARPLSVNEVLNWTRSGGAAQRLDEPTLEAARRCVAGLREARDRKSVV